MATPNASALDWCHRCQEDTPTTYRQMRAGVGNLCSVCGSCRKGRPYVPKSYLTTPTPQDAVKRAPHALASR